MKALLPPSLDDITTLAEAAFAALPEAFRAKAGRVVFTVEDFADEDTLAELEIEDPFELTGLYQGVGLPFDSELSPGAEPPRVFLYRRPLLDEWAERGDVDLAELVAHVLVHELAHHFGWSDEEIDAALGE
jgi:predicted Zn-dependent protease with MMP-like domain